MSGSARKKFANRTAAAPCAFLRGVFVWLPRPEHRGEPRMTVFFADRQIEAEQREELKN